MGSEMCIRDSASSTAVVQQALSRAKGSLVRWARSGERSFAGVVGFDDDDDSADAVVATSASVMIVSRDPAIEQQRERASSGISRPQDFPNAAAPSLVSRVRTQPHPARFHSEPPRPRWTVTGFAIATSPAGSSSRTIARSRSAMC